MKVQKLVQSIRPLVNRPYVDIRLYVEAFRVQNALISGNHQVIRSAKNKIESFNSVAASLNCEVASSEICMQNFKFSLTPMIDDQSDVHQLRAKSIKNAV